MSPSQPPTLPPDEPFFGGERFGRPRGGWRRRWHVIIFDAHTPAARRFNLVLIAAIVASVCVVVLDSVESLAARYDPVFHALEWAFTVLFTLEYLARLACVTRPARYARSFFGVVDLLAVVPTYLALFLPGAHALLDVRVLRLLRLFRLLKLAAYMWEFRALAAALAASRRKILVFLSFVAMVVLVMGTLMYVVEGPAHGYTSIPTGVYWAIVTMTTVGYGDVTPHTDAGRFIASVMMLLGWGILAVPTGIVSAEMTAARLRGSSAACPQCAAGGHDADARFCKHCGATLRGP